MYKKPYIFSFLALFSSLSTIFCCALPIILVTLGMGASFAAFTLNFPFIIKIAQHANALFIIAFLLLILSGYLIFCRPQSCPADKELAAICIRSKKITKIIFFATCFIFVASFFFKYILILIV